MSAKQRRIKVLRNLRIEILALLGHLLLKLLYHSLRWEKEGMKQYQQWLAENNPKIPVFWHCQQLMLGQVFAALNRKKIVKRAVVLISRSDDGRIIARIMRYLGIDSVAGSSSRGGAIALKQMVDELASGSCVVFTPDGPKGPARRVKPGVVKAAQESGRPICIKVYGAQKSWRFRSWDGMFLPKPFSRAVVKTSGPIYVPADLSAEQFEACRVSIENELNRLTDMVDNYEYK